MQRYDELPEPPECPPWCRVTHETRWDMHPGVTDRVCRRIVQTAADAEIMLQRYASVEDGQVQVEAPTIEVHAPQAMYGWDAAQLADTLARVVDIMAEPGLAA